MTSDPDRWLVFESGATPLRVPAASVQSIESYAAGEPLPFATALTGVLPVRGELVAVLSLTAPDASGAEPQRLLVVRSALGLVGVACTQVLGILSAQACDHVTPVTPDDLASRALAGS